MSVNFQKKEKKAQIFPVELRKKYKLTGLTEHTYGIKLNPFKTRQANQEFEICLN